MIAVIVVIILGLVLAAVIWTRVGTNRSERRSVEGYGRALGVLGDVAKRSDAAAPVHPDQAGRTHLLSSEAPEADAFRPAERARRDVPAARVHLEPPVLPGMVDEARNGPTSGEGPKHPAEPGEAVAAALGAGASDGASDPDVGSGGPGTSSRDDPSARRRRPSGPRARRPPSARSGSPRSDVRRRNVARAAALIVLGAAVAGGWKLASGGSSPAQAPVAPAPVGHHHSATPSHAHHGTAPANPTVLEPATVTSSLVTYDVAATSYTVAFRSGGTCWLGVEKDSSPSAWLWMKTLDSGQSAVYDASGTTTIRLGAPSAVTLRVDGVPVALPSHVVHSYDVTFVAEGGTSSA